MIYSRYSQQYAWEIICLQLNGFHTARSRGGQQQARIGIPELAFLLLSPTPPLKVSSKCEAVLLTPIAPHGFSPQTFGFAAGRLEGM